MCFAATPRTGVDSDSGSDFASSSEEEPDGDSLEALFAFDLDKVAEALKTGADVQELTNLIEESMGDTLGEVIEGRLDAADELEEEDADSDAEGRVEDAGDAGVGQPSPAGACFELSGLMTPELREGEDALVVEPEQLVSQVHEALPEEVRCRRASAGALQRRLSVRLVDAVQEASRQRRKSVMLACEDARARRLGEDFAEEDRAAAIEEMRRLVSKDARNHMKSLLKAAEVLEVAGIGLNDEAPEAPAEECKETEVADKRRPAVDTLGTQISDKLQLLQDAMKDARRRHRQSIAQAVQEASVANDRASQSTTKRAQKKRGTSSTRMPIQTLAAEKVNKSIARAYADFQERKARRAQVAASSPSCFPSALMRTGNLVAVIHAGSGDKGMARNAVHCGLEKATQPPDVSASKKTSPGDAVTRQTAERSG